MSQLLTVSPGTAHDTAGLYDFLQARQSASGADLQVPSADRQRSSPAAAEPVARLPDSRTDELALSDRARETADPDAATQAARLARIRNQITRGEYLTFDKIEVAVEKLHEEIVGG